MIQIDKNVQIEMNIQVMKKNPDQNEFHQLFEKKYDDIVQHPMKLQKKKLKKKLGKLNFIQQIFQKKKIFRLNFH